MASRRQQSAAGSPRSEAGRPKGSFRGARPAGPQVSKGQRSAGSQDGQAVPSGLVTTSEGHIHSEPQGAPPQSTARTLPG